MTASSTTTSSAVSSHRPDGFPAIVPFLVVDDPDRLIRFLQSVFEVEILNRSDAHGKLYVAVKVEGSVVEISRAKDPGNSLRAALHIYVEDTDRAYGQAIENGAKPLFEPADMDYGERGAGVEDLEGNHWYLATYTGCLSS